MRKLTAILLATMATLTLSAQKTEWKDRSIPAVNKEYPHADYMLYTSRAKALTNDYSDSKFFKSLNGKWNFKYVTDIELLPQNFQDPAYDDSSWDKFDVPANWETNGYGIPIYINSPFEFDPNTEFEGITGHFTDANESGNVITSITLAKNKTGTAFLNIEGELPDYAKEQATVYIGICKVTIRGGQNK